MISKEINMVGKVKEGSSYEGCRRVSGATAAAARLGRPRQLGALAATRGARSLIIISASPPSAAI